MGGGWALKNVYHWMGSDDFRGSVALQLLLDLFLMSLGHLQQEA